MFLESFGGVLWVGFSWCLWCLCWIVVCLFWWMVFVIWFWIFVWKRLWGKFVCVGCWLGVSWMKLFMLGWFWLNLWIVFCFCYWVSFLVGCVIGIVVCLWFFGCGVGCFLKILWNILLGCFLFVCLMVVGCCCVIIVWKCVGCWNRLWLCGNGCKWWCCWSVGRFGSFCRVVILFMIGKWSGLLMFELDVG